MNHWDKQAIEVKDDNIVNIADLPQRELENFYICKYLKPDMSILEVGCGNGYSTNVFRNLVKHVDAFDISAAMIERAKKSYGEINNKFYVGNAIELNDMPNHYDMVLCVRVLINISPDYHLAALRNIAKAVAPGGCLILVEGFTFSYQALNILRETVGLDAINPPIFNRLVSKNDAFPVLDDEFILTGSFHLGNYDYLTRIFYPRLISPGNVKYNTTFHYQAAELTKLYNPDCFRNISRVQGYVFTRIILDSK